MQTAANKTVSTAKTHKNMTITSSKNITSIKISKQKRPSNNMKTTNYG